MMGDNFKGSTDRPKDQQQAVLELANPADNAGFDRAADRLVDLALAAHPEADRRTLQANVSDLLDALVDQGQITDLQARIAWTRLAAFLSVKPPIPSGSSGGRARKRPFVSNQHGISHPSPVSKANKKKRDYER